MDKVYNLYNLEPLFKSYLVAEKVSFVTLKNYLSDIRHFLGWLAIYRETNNIEGNYAFDKDSIASYLNYLKIAEIPDSTFNRRLSTLRKFCYFCFTINAINANFLYQQQVKTNNLQNNPQINLIKVYSDKTSSIASSIVSSFKRFVILRYVLLIVLIGVISGYISLATFSKKPVRSARILSTGSGRVLTFQGNLTDNLGNPITDKTDIVFRLYPQDTAGSTLYTGKCVGENALTPDVKGVFSATVGSDCGMQKIPTTVFTDNPNLYLGITVGSDPEMRPRQKIANTGTAVSAESLQGLPVGTDINTIPYIDPDGILKIAAVSPTIQSTSGAFTIQGTTLTLATNPGKAGDIIISPSQGNVLFSSGNVSIGESLNPLFKLQVAGDIGPSTDSIFSIGSPLRQWANVYGEKLYQNNYEVCDTSGNCNGTNSWKTFGQNVFLSSGGSNLGVGSSAPIHKLDVTGSVVGKALAALWEQGDQDILVASRSATTPTTVFRLTNSGNIITANNSRWMPLSDSTSGLNIATSGDIPFVTFDTLNQRLGLGTTTPVGKLNVSGADTGKALVILNQTGDQDILSASASGTTKFVITNDGSLAVGQDSLASNRQIDTSSGAYLTSSGVWTDASSRAWKTNFTQLDYSQILDRVKSLPITQWTYKTDPMTIKHIGPVAEDFFTIFGLGNDNQHVAALDTAGIALASVKGLAEENDQIKKLLNTANENILENIYNENQTKERLNSLNTLVNHNLSTNDRFLYDGLTQESKNNIITDVANTLNNTKINILDTSDLFVRNVLKSNFITSNSLTALISHIESLTSKYINVSDKITSPVVESKDIFASGEAKLAKIKTNQIDTLNDNLTINLNKTTSNNNSDEHIDTTSEASNNEDKGPLAQLIIKGLNNRTVGSIDAKGNATFSGTLSANAVQTNNITSDSLFVNAATVSGELFAKNIHSENIDNLSRDITNTRDNLTSTTSNIQTLTNNVNDIQRILGNLQSQPINSPSYQSLMNSLILSLGNVVQSSATNSTNVAQNMSNLDKLTVLGSADIYKLGISDSLTVGNVLVRDNSILSLAWDLDISSLSNVNFFGGMVSLQKDGNLITNGQVIAQGGVRTNSLTQLSQGSDIEVQLKSNTNSASNPKLTIKDDRNEQVASIDSQGTGNFASLSLNKYIPSKNNTIISATDNFAKNGQFSPALETKNYSAGEGILPNNNSAVLVYNERVKDDSLVYLTSTSIDPSIHLSILEKKTCSIIDTSCKPYFKVGSDKISPTPITFNWLLVN